MIIKPRIIYNKVLAKMNVEKCHIVAYSLSGIDFRYYISQLNGDQYIESLTRLATPNK